jgi:branched-chain amino acid transport system ATP-binding protein
MAAEPLTEPATGGTSADAVLKISDIGVRYSGVVAVDGVSLSVRPGEVLALIGPNGAGKTSLFDAVSGARAPQSGRVLLGGHDVSSASAMHRARLGLRRTFQRQQVFGGLSVEDNVLSAREWRGGGGGMLGDLLALPSRRRRETARRADIQPYLDACGLTDLRQLPAAVLPIGQARMLELARALAGEPTVLLLDEPTSGLGEAEVERLAAIIDRTKATGSAAIVLIEHDIAFVMRHADRVAVLVRGALIAEGTPTEIQSDEHVRSAYLA